jgi:hypothetical protein
VVHIGRKIHDFERLALELRQLQRQPARVVIDQWRGRGQGSHSLLPLARATGPHLPVDESKLHDGTRHGSMAPGRARAQGSPYPALCQRDLAT